MCCGSTILIDASAPTAAELALLTPDASGATRALMRAFLVMLQECAGGAARLSVEERSRAAWQELRNKVEAFCAFEHVDALLGSSLELPLPSLISRTEALPLPLRVWATEGVGYHVTSALARVRPQRLPLLDTPLPRRALLPLHAGMGSALATAVLDGIVAVPRADVDARLARFERGCVANSDDEHLGVALEALGFMTCSMFSRALELVAATTKAQSTALHRLFWHGAGRAAYFAPSATSAADDPWRPVSGLMRVAGVDAANAVAGYAWAATLVNLRHPHVLEPLVITAAGGPRSEMCGVGVQSALEAWRRCAPDDNAIETFDAYEPAAPAARRAWHAVIGDAPRPGNCRPAGDLFAAEYLCADALGEAS
jgi:hypothetical protein